MDLETRIEDLLEKNDIEDNNLIIVEDKEDTKKATVEELKKAFVGDNESPSSILFYSTKYLASKLDKIISSDELIAVKQELEKTNKRVSQISASAGTGKDTEVVDARDGESSLHERILRDKEELTGIKMDKLSEVITVKGNPIVINNPKNIAIGLCTINIIYPNITDIGTLVIKDGNDTVNKDIVGSNGAFEYRLKNDACELSCNIPNSEISITYTAYDIDSKYLYDKCMELQDKLYDEKDKCGLITDYGTYVYPRADLIFNKNDDDATYTISDDQTRDKKSSLKIHTRLEATANPKFTIKCDPVNFDLCTLVFYVSKDIIKAFDSTDGLIIKLSSDSPLVIPSNYYQYNISNTEMINGWNCLKKPLKDFIKVGSPDKAAIQSIRLEIVRNDQINNSDIYISSIIFNQKMKPTLLLNFNGVYDHGFEYTYPYLYSRNIPCTIFTNSGTTLTKDAKAKLSKYHYTYGWDIAPYGCHPNKELLIQDDNDYEQYINLLFTDSYIKALRANPISYSAPYGNLQDNTCKILKSMGYKIARIENIYKNTYCSFFGRNDFCMPVIKVGNKNNSEDINEWIDYIIETGQCMALFTNDVTEYGTDSSLKEVTFENVIDHIMEKVDSGELQLMTFEGFYNKCVNE